MLQGIVVLIGIGILVFMLWEPHLEGRNVHATLFEIYFRDPFLAYVYFGSIPFFVALSRIYKALGYVGQDRTYSQATLEAVRTVKYCAVALIALIGGAEGYFFLVRRGKDDITGGVAVGLMLILVAIVVAAVAGKFERILKKQQ